MKRILALPLLILVLTGCTLPATATDGARENYEALMTSSTYQPSLRPLYQAKTEEKVAALTFDLSWGTQVGPVILDILKKENVRATFFLSGPWAKRHVEIVQRIHQEGHEVESHGQAHVNLNELGREGAAKNIGDAHAILEGLTGRAPTYIRPPNGAFNDASVQAAKDLGYATVMWSVDSRDWMNPGTETIINRATKLMHPGAVVLFHASDTCKQTHLALPTILQQLRADGYRFVTLDELFKQYGVDPKGFIHVRPGQKA
jgi:polysaccharide deacetylase family sporulation protein PdaB